MANGIARAYSSDRQLQKAALQWQRRLRLRDWTIEVAHARSWDMGDNPSTLGLCGYNRPNKHAFIQVLDPADYAPDCVIPYDADEIVVHEMLHVVLSGLHGSDDKEVAEDEMLETAINQLAKSFVEAYR